MHLMTAGNRMINGDLMMRTWDYAFIVRIVFNMILLIIRRKSLMIGELL